MANFFKDFPTIMYSLDGGRTRQEVTNIFRRFDPIDKILKEVRIYHEYIVKDGYTPSIVSYDFYNTVEYDWLILMFNRRVDPFFHWPLSDKQMSKHLIAKYGSIENSTQTVHHYEQILTERNVLTDLTVIEERSIIVDETTYNSLPEPVRKIVYNYDYEVQENEKYRTVRLIDPRYIPQIMREKELIFND